MPIAALTTLSQEPRARDASVGSPTWVVGGQGVEASGLPSREHAGGRFASRARAISRSQGLGGGILVSALLA